MPGTCTTCLRRCGTLGGLRQVRGWRIRDREARSERRAGGARGGDQLRGVPHPGLALRRRVRPQDGPGVARQHDGGLVLQDRRHHDGGGLAGRRRQPDRRRGHRRRPVRRRARGRALRRRRLQARQRAPRGRQAGHGHGRPDRWQPLSLAKQISQNGIEIPGSIQAFIGPHWGHVTSFALPPSETGTPIDPGLPPDSTMPRLTRRSGTRPSRSSGSVPSSTRRTRPPSTSAQVPGGQCPRRQRRQRARRQPGHGPAICPERRPPRRFQPGPGRALGRRAEVGDATWALERHRQPGLGRAGRRAPHRWPGARRRPARVGRQALPGPERRSPRRRDRNGASRASTTPPSDLDDPLHGRQGPIDRPRRPVLRPRRPALVAGLVEVVTAESSAPGERHAGLARAIGKVAIRAWRGFPEDPTTETSGVGWILAVDWVPYQRSTFVTPGFAGYPSGHSTFSRAAAQVMTAFTGNAYFPGGMTQATVKAGDLIHEEGPTSDVTIQWATYNDAADAAANRASGWASHHRGRSRGPEDRRDLRRRRDGQGSDVLRRDRPELSFSRGSRAGGGCRGTRPGRRRSR